MNKYSLFIWVKMTEIRFRSFYKGGNIMRGYKLFLKEFAEIIKSKKILIPIEV
ncbi:hypothetical protein ICU_03771 [Bacillus cereus BAG2X1-1]|nr:hypothetical protein ICU_03771 [Bacillus cereus BAG2X1-1]